MLPGGPKTPFSLKKTGTFTVGRSVKTTGTAFVGHSVRPHLFLCCCPAASAALAAAVRTPAASKDTLSARPTRMQLLVRACTLRIARARRALVSLRSMCCASVHCAVLRRAAAAYADGCEWIFHRVFTPEFWLIESEPARELAADMARFCVYVYVTMAP